MCTATWLINQNGYELFFNRDELKTRLEGIPPKLANAGGVRYISPVDSEAGGTWIAVNEYGFSACLLNFYAPTIGRKSYAGSVSRGRIIHLVIKSRSTAEAEERITREDLHRYRPFSLLLFCPGNWPVRLRWRGAGNLGISRSPSVPQSSSSFETEKVVESRKRLHTRKYSASNVSGLLRYHRSHEPIEGPYSVCMHRKDAETHSFSHISVTQQRVGFSYTAGSPCSADHRPWIMLQCRVA